MDRRLQYAMASLVLLIHSAVAQYENLTIDYMEIPTECVYNFDDNLKLVNVTAPFTPPRIHPGNYESIMVLTPGQRVTRDVIVYWENYLECNEAVQFRYRAYYLVEKSNGRLTKVNADLLYRNYAIFTELRHDIAYNFEVVSMNMDGASDVSIIYVPSETDKTRPSKPLWLKKNATPLYGVYLVSWENPYDQMPSRFHRSNTYTLHWCENEPNSMSQCNGKLFSMTVPLTQSRRLVKIGLDETNFQFGISAEMVTVGDTVNTSISSGLQWEKCSMQPNPRPEIIIIRKIWVTKVGPTFIALRWKIDCSSMPEYFVAYQIYYCPVISRTNRRCIDKLALKFLGKMPQNDIVPIAVIPNLKPGTLYMFSVDILTRVDHHVSIRFRTVPHFQGTRSV